MAALGAQSIASSYEQLLQVDRDGGGNTTTHVSVKDGDNGTTFGFTIATDALMMSSTNRLEFGDTGTYIHQSADGVLDLVSDTEIEINATTIDMNGALDLSGNAQLSGTVTVGADGSGTDVIFYSGTAGDNFTWDASEEKLTITGTNGQTALDVADGNLVVADNVDIEGDIDVNGTANLDNTDIDGTFAVDGATISLDATTSLNIDNTNTTNGITVGTATSAVPISIGHTTSVVTVNDELDVTGTVDINDTTDSSSKTTGALKVDGGVGVALKLFVGTDLDVDGTANLDAVDIDGAVQIDNTITVGADDQGYDVIFYGDTASSNMTWDTSGDDLILNDSRLFIDQDDDDIAIRIDSESTSQYAIETTAKYCQRNVQDVSGGAGLFVYRNVAEAGSNPLASVNDGNANNTQAAFAVTQEGDGIAINIDQNGNASSIVIDSEATTAHLIEFNAPTNTSGNIISIDNANALTTGAGLSVESGGTALATTAGGGLVEILHNGNTGSNVNNLLLITNDHASSTDTFPLRVQQDADTSAIYTNATHATYAGHIQYITASGRSANSAFSFLTTITGGDSDTQHKLRGDGATIADAAYDGSGADYAEYFESKDGKVIAVGTTVKLDGDKVVICESGDTPIGVVRPYGNSVVIGNSAPLKWSEKYLTDDYGSPVKEEYSVTEWMEDTDEVKTEAVEAKDAVLYEEGDEIPDGKKVGDEKEAAIEAKAVVYEHKDVQYWTDQIPSDVTVPDDATVTSTEKDGNKLMRKKLNPDYDESKTYKPREERDEWCLIGLLGQIPITKGQPMADSWIKMKDVSNSVEMYFVK